MKRIFRYITFVTLVSLSVSCVEEQFGNESTNPIDDPNAIQFGASTNSMETKTVFGDKVGTGSDAYWQVFWDNTEEYVEIFCPDAYNETEEDVLLAEYEVKAINKAADGTVSDAAAGTSSKGQITPRVDGKYLKWGGDSGKHRFYAAYPAKCAYISQHADSVGIMTFKINNNQVCTIPTNATSPFVAEPDMDYAYMVGTGEGEPASGKVALDFDPIMTTLTVTVTAPDVDNTSSTIITGISIISEVASVDALKGYFKYDAGNKRIVLGDITTPQTFTTFVGVKHDGKNYIELSSKESVTFTVFLPPVAIGPINSADLSQNPIEIRVHRTGKANLSAYIGKSKEAGDSSPAIYAKDKTIAPSTKCNVILPNLPAPTATSSNNWMTPLDDNIYVDQLSIPGTHDSATKNCSLSQGRCQDLTIEEQLEMGIRFFDLRPTSDGTIYHGELSCGITLEEVWTQFNTFLDENPGEFLFTLLRWESEGDVTLGFGLGAYKDYNSYMMEFVQSDLYKKYALSDGTAHNLIKKDLTIGEMRPLGTFTVNGQTVTRKQGRILSFIRPNQDIYVQNGATTVDRGGLFQGFQRLGEYCDTYITDYAPDTYAPDGMLFYTNFPGSLSNARGGYLKKKFVDYSSTSNGGNGLGQAGAQSVSTPADWDIYCQNYYEVSSGDENTKISAVKEYMEVATAEANALSHIWVINHCSGYVVSALSSTSYANLSNKMNPAVYDYILQRTTPGALGFVLLDFVGSRYSSASDELEVHGDLLPQTIIDNNYKYVMKRKQQ